MCESDMYATDLELFEKDDGFYQIQYNGEEIRCLFTDDLLESQNEQLMSYIIQDFDRCGLLGIIDKRIDTGNVNCAYTVFSIQKLKSEDKSKRSIIENQIPVALKYDSSLIQVANGPPLELEELARLMPLRHAISEEIGEDAFKELTDYAWAAYYAKSVFGDSYEYQNEDLPGTWIEDEEFSEKDYAKKIKHYAEGLTIEQFAVFCTLCEAVHYKSILLPLALVKGWISRSDFISGGVTVGGGIVNLSGIGESTNESHQQDFEFMRSIVDLGLEYLKFNLSDLLVRRVKFMNLKRL